MVYGGLFRGTVYRGGLQAKVKCPECGEPAFCWQNPHDKKEYNGICINCQQAVQIRTLL
jgi:hypothetical protein